MKTHASEQGQVLVLILLAIVGLMGFAALAVDGGQIYSERRRSQSAADAAALAAASKGSDTGTAAEVAAAGLDMASLNGFANDGTTTVEIHNPPVSGPYSTSSDKDLYYQAIITTKVRPIFAQFVFGGDEWITTEAVVKADEISPFSGTNAIIGLNHETGNSTVEFDGATKVDVTGGNIYSNSDININGVGSGHILVNSGEILANGNRDLNGPVCGPGQKVNPCPKPAPVLAAPELPEPYCPPVTASNPTTYGTVNYYVWTDNYPKAPNKLQPGIHCFYGDGHNNAIVLNSDREKVQGDGVVLVLKKGGITLTGGAILAITRPNDLIDINGNQVGGLVIYVSKDNYEIRHGVKDYPVIMVGGNTDSQLNGTVFAPNSLCKIGGSSEANAYHTSIICNEVMLHGGLKLFIDYDAAENVWTAPSLSVSQ